MATRPSDDHDAAFRTVIPPMLSFVSGFVDTIGFLGFAGLLTSQVTGSFVAAGAAFVHPEPGLAAKLLAIPMFMVGAGAMTVLVAVLRRAGARSDGVGAGDGRDADRVVSGYFGSQRPVCFSR